MQRLASGVSLAKIRTCRSRALDSAFHRARIRQSQKLLGSRELEFSNCLAAKNNGSTGAQKFIPSTLHKMRMLAEIRSQRRLNYRIEVDGGVAGDTVTHVFMSRCLAAMQVATG